MKAIEKASGLRTRKAEQRVWKVAKAGQPAGWFIVDEVLGKHEFITYALALDPSGTIKSIEVMEYRENYGSEIRRADWRQQFVGKKASARLKLDDAIKNISGATLSCRHLTEGVRRLLALHELILKN
jgi:Na+-translocating ferredoxin:NAD+ oxidoreductase RnfG subunit